MVGRALDNEVTLDGEGTLDGCVSVKILDALGTMDGLVVSRVWTE